jgi:hypothetical protein
MSIYSVESLALLIPTLICFKALPDLTVTVIKFKATSLDNTLKLLIVLIAAGLVCSIKWYSSRKASITLFSVLFTCGAILMILRYLLTTGIAASFKRFSADPLALLVQVIIGVIVAISSSLNIPNSPLAGGFIASNQSLFFLLVLFMVLFRPMFAFHELMDAKYFLTPAPEDVSRSSLSDYRWPKRNLSLGQMLLAGSAPWILILVTGFVEADIRLLPITGVLVGILGITMARPLAEFWTIIESIRAESGNDKASLSKAEIASNFSVLVCPYMGLLLLSLADLVSYSYTLFVESNSDSQLLTITNVFPDKLFLKHVLSLSVSLMLLVIAIQTLVTIVYKRLVAHMKSYLKSK